MQVLYNKDTETLEEAKKKTWRLYTTIEYATIVIEALMQEIPGSWVSEGIPEGSATAWR